MSSLVYLDIEAAMMICELFIFVSKHLTLTPDCVVARVAVSEPAFVCKPICMHVCMCACVYVCVYECTCMYVCMCARVCVHVCMYVCSRVHV